MTPGLWSTGAAVVAHGLSCPAACGLFLDQGLNPNLLHWQAVFTTEPPGKPKKQHFKTKTCKAIHYHQLNSNDGPCVSLALLGRDPYFSSNTTKVSEQCHGQAGTQVCILRKAEPSSN